MTSKEAQAYAKNYRSFEAYLTREIDRATSASLVARLQETREHVRGLLRKYEQKATARRRHVARAGKKRQRRQARHF